MHTLIKRCYGGPISNEGNKCGRENLFQYAKKHAGKKMHWQTCSFFLLLFVLKNKAKRMARERASAL